MENTERTLHKCKLGTYNANCQYKVDKTFCCAEHCGFMGEEVTNALADSDCPKEILKHEPKWFEKYYH